MAELADRILAVATGSGARMPPGRVLDDQDQADLVEWIACGMPGDSDGDVWKADRRR